METTSQILEQTPFRQALSVGRFITKHLVCGAWGETAEAITRPEASITYHPPLGESSE